MGVYASSQIGSGQSNQGFTINANKAKGSSSETTTTHTNTQVTVGGITVNDIGGNLILDGANLDTTHLTGTVDGDLIVNSRQDDYQYTHDQKQAGFSADVGFNGKPQSFSINGGKTDVDADYAQVTHQSGIKANQSTLSVQGQGKFTGGYLITDAGKNQTQFAQGIQTQDIQNHLNYEGDAISVGIGIGVDTSNPNGKAKPALQGIGYGTIDPVNKTSTTHAAITDQAGLSHINTENFNQQEVQNQLNQIITNDFDKEQVLTELGAQVNITTEFHKEAPQRVAEFSGYQEAVILSKLDNAENLSDEQINQILDEAAKWGEGGIYRVALHTATAALATGTIEGAASAGTTAYAIPKIDEYLKEQGFDESTRQTTLLAISAGLGATISNSTASTVNNVGQVQWNYLTHKELQAKIIELNACGFEKSCIDMVNKKYNEISKQNDMALHDSCRAISTDCIGKMRDALDYVGEDKYLDFKTDIHQSRKRVLDVANFNGYYAITDLSTRADYFGAMYDYTKQPWFGVAEEVSRTDLARAEIAGFENWVSDAGKVIMKNGKSEFQWIYYNHHNAPADWSDQRLVNEQTDSELQNVHQSYYHRWHPGTQFLFNKKVGFTPSKIDPFLDSRNRIHKGRFLIKEFKQKHGVR